MARRTVFDESSDDEFPDINALGRRRRAQPQSAASPTRNQGTLEEDPCKSTIRRRELAQIADNPLLRPWNAKERSPIEGEAPLSDGKRSGPRVQLRKRAQKPSVVEIEVDENSSDDGGSGNASSEDESSEFHTALDSGADDDSFVRDYATRSPVKPLSPKKKAASASEPPNLEKSSTARRNGCGEPRRERREALCTPPKAVYGASGTVREHQQHDAANNQTTKSSLQESSESSLAKSFSRLQTEENDYPGVEHLSSKSRPTTPTGTPPKPRGGRLVSPKKLPRIPMTPHRPSVDTFWSQEFVDEWNDEHSPKKTLWLPEVTRSPSKKSPSKKADPGKAARKAFESAKHDLADNFLKELDSTITGGRLQELAESTGGIKIKWTNKLNTTAGRANWKRETIKTKQASGDEVVTRHRHHASIELAEKVIDDEHRLLNVIAHEFCHLANFMVSGVTGNPHGKEFKAWAAKCSRSFSDRGIEVTTKHTYDIDFKYIWECATCSMEFKRHSKSINPERHRCGSCKGELKQTKPVPRASNKASEYQKFMREQMKLVKEENPGSPQKEIMKIVADKWSRKDTRPSETTRPDTKVNDVADVLVQLTLED